MAEHTILGGKVHIYKREHSSHHWQCSTYLGGKNRRVSTKLESLAQAEDFAEDWYLELRGKYRAGELKSEKTFSDAAAQFEREYPIITEGQRSAKYVEGLMERLRVHVVPFFGNLGLSRSHARQDPGISDSPPRRGDGEVWQAARAKHASPGDRCLAINLESGGAARMAQVPSGPVRAVQILRQDRSPRVVFSR